eukprot:TRINITY_DN1344_c0_g2_i1.p1 TRINITY_DN1344_c0_g2~~TRINITY_DN1344_c0_g2_i1.p1  ORF type:complete len:217 (+),score=52.46 TRINITY_DN1344_c0_g2_i1:162-812(+)
MVVVEQWSKAKDQFADAHVNLVFIGTGGEPKGREYAEILKIPPDKLFLDPARKSHAVLNLESGWLKLMSDTQGLAKSREASKKGFKVKIFGTGSYTQLGGVAVVTKDERMTFLHRCQTTYDYPDIEAVLDNCTKAASSDSGEHKHEQETDEEAESVSEEREPKNDAKQHDKKSKKSKKKSKDKSKQKNKKKSEAEQEDEGDEPAGRASTSSDSAEA